MKFDNEKEFEDLLFKDLISDNKSELPMSGILRRQVPVPGYGVMDILSVDIWQEGPYVRVDITICELKVCEISHLDVTQISRYYRGVVEYLGRFYNIDTYQLADEHETSSKNITVNIKGILIGPKYKESNVCYLVDSMDWLSFYSYNLSLSGVTFDLSNGYHSAERTDSKIVNQSINVIESKLVEVYKESIKGCKGRLPWQNTGK